MRKSYLLVALLVVLVSMFMVIGAASASPSGAENGAPSAAPAAGPVGIYITSLKGVKQGQIKGEVTSKGVKNSIKLDSVDYEVVSPRDAASGLPTGKRQHKPVTVISRVGSQSPQLFTAITQNEKLSEVVIRFNRPDTAGKGATGQASNYFTIKLTDATIADYHTTTSDGSDQMESVSPTFQKIEFIYEKGGITAADDWESPVS